MSRRADGSLRPALRAPRSGYTPPHQRRRWGRRTAEGDDDPGEARTLARVATSTSRAAADLILTLILREGASADDAAAALAAACPCTAAAAARAPSEPLRIRSTQPLRDGLSLVRWMARSVAVEQCGVYVDARLEFPPGALLKRERAEVHAAGRDSLGAVVTKSEGFGEERCLTVRLGDGCAARLAARAAAPPSGVAAAVASAPGGELGGDAALLAAAAAARARARQIHRWVEEASWEHRDPPLSASLADLGIGEIAELVRRGQLAAGVDEEGEHDALVQLRTIIAEREGLQCR